MKAPILGIIEGFYGVPYSHDVRLEIFDLMAAWGWNSYVWAAKLEPRHRELWDQPFTPEELGPPKYDNVTKTLTLFAMGIAPINLYDTEAIILRDPSEPYSICDFKSAAWHVDTMTY